VAAALGAAALTPATRPLLRDERITSLTARELGYHVLLRIPVGTVLWEEIAFRGVLHAALRRVLAEPAAAGALLSVLRGRSGSLAAPVLVHLTANCTGALASAAASRLIREGSAGLRSRSTESGPAR
jgi:uncharacterized protein